MEFCSSCGKELKKREKFCSSCNAEVVYREETSTVVESVDSRKASKSTFSKKWVTIATIAVLFIGGGSALGMYTLSKSPKELFLLSEYNSYQQFNVELDKKYGEEIAFQKMLLETPSSSEVKISGNLEIESEYDNEYNMMLQNFLEKTTLVLQTEQDPSKQASHHNLAIEVDGTNAVEFEIIQTKNQAGIKIPMLYDQFFYFNLDQYGELRRMSDPYYEGPETLEVADYKWDEMKLNEKEIASIKKSYTSFLLEELKEENFRLDKDVNYEHEGETLSLREITFELSPSETEDFISNLFNHLIEDDEMHSILADRVVTIAKSSATDPEFDKELTDKKHVIKELKSGLKEMKKEASLIKYPDGIKYVLLIDKEEQVIDRQINFAIKDQYNEKLDFVVTTKNVNGEKNKIFKEVTLVVSSEDKEMGIFEVGYTNTITNNKDQRTEDVKAKLNFEEDGHEVDTVLAVKSVFNEEDRSKQTIEREFELQVNGEEFGDTSFITGSINQDKDISVKNKYANRKIDIKIHVQGEFEPGTISILVDSKTKLKDKMDFPKLDSDAGQNVLELTENDVYAIFGEMEYRLAETFQELGLVNY